MELTDLFETYSSIFTRNFWNNGHHLFKLFKCHYKNIFQVYFIMDYLWCFLIIRQNNISATWMKRYFIWWKTQWAGPDKCWTVITCAKYHFVTFVDKKVLQNKYKKRAKLTLSMWYLFFKSRWSSPVLELNEFHLHCPRKVMGISWEDRVSSNTEVLDGKPSLATDHSAWRIAVQEGVQNFQKKENWTPSTAVRCLQCGCICASNLGLCSHLWGHWWCLHRSRWTSMMMMMMWM